MCRYLPTYLITPLWYVPICFLVRHQYDVHQLQCEVERLKDLAATYEQGIEKKDQVISKLSDAFQKQVGMQCNIRMYVIRAYCTDIIRRYVYIKCSIDVHMVQCSMVNMYCTV